MQDFFSPTIYTPSLDYSNFSIITQATKSNTNLMTPSLPSLPPHRDRFRTTVNVLGDTFGVGIVQYYSKKQLGHLPDHATPPQQAGEGDENSADSATNSNREGAHSPDYGASSSSPPPPTLPHIPTPQWSVRSSSLDSTHDQQRSDASSNSERRIAAGSTYQKIREETVL